jgi:hypothetical protein
MAKVESFFGLILSMGSISTARLSGMSHSREGARPLFAYSVVAAMLPQAEHLKRHEIFRPIKTVAMFT